MQTETGESWIIWNLEIHGTNLFRAILVTVELPIPFLGIHIHGPEFIEGKRSPAKIIRSSVLTALVIDS